MSKLKTGVMLIRVVLRKARVYQWITIGSVKAHLNSFLRLASNITLEYYNKYNQKKWYVEG